MLDKLSEMSMIQSIEELPDIHVEYPSATGSHRLLPQALQRLMRRAARPEPVRSLMEEGFVQGFQDRDHRPLKHLVFKGRNSNRSRVASRALRNMRPSHWRCVVRAGLGPF